MQDIHPIGGVAGAGGIAFGDRRLRPHGHHHQQALKCPRCDSINTKFCYYNNYNLSQPRYFCKNCRRYWTKGGVLRNVPVGGGCRKSNRSKPKPKPKPKPSSPALKTPNSLSSSDSSTTSTTAAFRVAESENFGVNVGLEPLMESNHQIDEDQVIFSSEIGGFANLMSNSTDPGTTAALNQFLHSQPQWEIDGSDEKTQGGMFDPTMRIEYDDLLQNRVGSGGLAALDWQETAAAGDQSGALGLFDHQSYWSQTTSSDTHIHLHHQWSDHANSDLPLFLP